MSETLSSMVIRKATIEDWEKIAELRLNNALFHAALSEMYSLREGAEERLMKDSQKLIVDDQSIVLVADLKADVQGYIIGIIKGEHPIFKLPKIGFVDDIYVTSKGKGIGQLLVSALLKEFQNHQIGRVELKVYVGNKQANQFWNKCGFENHVLGMFQSVESI